MVKKRAPTIREKTNYINDLILKQNGLKLTDIKAYTYIYDITKYVVNKHINTTRFTSDIPEEIVQNIVIQVFKRFDKSLLEKKGKDANLLSIFPYLTKCAFSESVKLKSITYDGRLPRVDDETLKEFYFDKEDIKQYPTFETDAIIKIERKVISIIKEIQKLVEENFITVEDKNFIVFPLLLAISRQSLTLFDKYPSRVKTTVKQIYFNTKNPLDRIKFK